MAARAALASTCPVKYPSLHRVLSLRQSEDDRHDSMGVGNCSFVPFPEPAVAVAEDYEPHEVQLPKHLADVPLQFIKDKMYALGRQLP